MSRVLLVDDDIAEISAVKRVLVRAGHQPVLATNAADAMIAVDQQQPELLVVSATCENGEALTLARALRENAATAHLPLVILGDADSLPKGARRLARPLDPELLGSELKAALAPADGISISVEPPAPEPQPAARPAARSAAGKPGARPGPGPVRPAAAKPSPSGPAPARPEPGKPASAKSAGAPAASPGGGRPGGAVAIGRLLPSPGPAAPAPEDGPALADGSAGSGGTGDPDANPSPVRRGLPAPGSRTALPSGAKLSDAAASRRAAADALRARAEELRRSSQRPPPAPASAAEPAPSGAPRPSPILIEPLPAGSSRPSLAESLDLEEGELEATLKRAEAASGGGNGSPETGRSAADQARREAAEEALRALEEEASTHAAEVARSRSAAAEETTGSHELPGREAASAAEERALQEAIETARRQAFESARREAFETAKRELQEQARQEAAEAARLIQAEARGRQEAVAAAQKEARELARREAEATERARSAEQELQSLRSQLDEERRKAEERVATVMQRAAEEEEALEETSRGHAAEEQKLRGAIASARSEMEALRRRHDEESRRREEVEYALRRMAGGRRDRAGPTEDAAEPAPDFTPPPFFAPFDGAEAPDPDPAEEAARRRVAALRASPPGDGEAASALGSGPAGGDAATGEVEPSPSPEEPARSLSQPSPQLRAGDLAELPAPRLLAMAWKARLEGRLDFRGETARSLWFEDGRVVGASSADPSERVEEVALRLGLVTRDQHRQIAQAAATLPSRRAALLLLERGFLKATELTGLVRRRTEEVVFGVFADAEARFRWMGIEVPPEERTALERGTLALAVEGVRRRWLAPRVDALLGGPATLLAPVPGAPSPAELGLSAEERRAVGLADGLRALEEVLQASPLDALSTRQVLAALVLTGALSIRALQAGRPAGHALAAIDLARVKEKLEQVRRADYFTVLGVGRLCTPHEVREAAERLQAEFDPRRFAAQGDEGLPARLAEILEVVHDAREVLADDRLRDEYLRGLGDVS